MREPEEFPPMPWWQALGGGLLMACFLYGMIWVFALLEWVVEGPPA